MALFNIIKLKIHSHTESPWAAAKKKYQLIGANSSSIVYSSIQQF